MRELFINQLLAEPNDQSGRAWSKINIHIPIRGSTLESCIEINESIKKISHSSIDFSATSFQMPHITLNMGFVSSRDNFFSIMTAVHKLAISIEPFKIGFSEPYLKEPKRSYSFCDTNSGDRIILLKRNLQKQISEFIEPLHWDVVGETPHITLAYIKSNFDQVEKALEKAPAPTPMMVDAIEVSFCGPYGSCLGSIRCFELSMGASRPPHIAGG